MDLPSYVTDYDFILLTETFSDKPLSDIFHDHLCFISPSVKVSDSVHGRTCGGLALMIKKTLANFVKQISLEYDNMLAIKCTGSLFGFENDVILIGIYLPPENSVYYADTEIYNGVSMLEDAVLDLSKMYPYASFILFGDLNARTSNENSCSTRNALGHIFDMYDKEGEENLYASVDNKRSSKDDVVNSFGRYLLNVCNDFELSILNGLDKLRLSSDFTYVSNTGCSVIDLFIVSNNILDLCENLFVHPLIESKHAAVSLFLKANTKTRNYHNRNEKIMYVKYKWNNDKCLQFDECLKSEKCREILIDANSLIDTNVDKAVSRFNEFMYNVGECMKINVNACKRPRSVWFDLECSQSRKVLRQYLRKFTRYNKDEDRLAYSEKRREYKNLLFKKKRDKKEETLRNLQNSINDPNTFWSCVQNILQNNKTTNISCSISIQEWYDYFHSVFNTVFPSSDCTKLFGSEPEIENSSDLNTEITEAELKAALNGLKNKKAAGPDGLLNEFFKRSECVIVPFLLKLFNYLFDNGIYPSDWTMSILQPIHKKGDVGLPDNYRGISLLNVCSKIYSSILNRRLSDWVEDNDILGEEQAGYRRFRSPMEHIFILHAIVNKQLVRHRKLYVAFIDFRKAFDGISRVKLWLVLRKRGISGKMLNALKSMYSVVKTKVRVNGLYTESFQCPNGLKQGEICSPIIFSLFIHELTKEIRKNGKHGVQLNPDIIHILILLFADDVALISDSVIGLQNQIDILYNTSRNLDLSVNLGKSNIIVFRNGGHLSKIEKWNFGGKSLSVINSYKYLGVFFSTRLSFTNTFEDLATRGKKGVIGILRALWSIGDHTPAIFFKLFDSQIQPILTYGAEIWGLTKNQEIIERVHLFALKRFLGVHIKTPRQFVYGDTGRFPLYVITYCKCVKFWLKLTSQNHGRLSRKAYNMLVALQKQNFVTWVDNIRNVLYMYGFGIVWETQGVGNQLLFLRAFKQRLIDCANQMWHSSIENREFFQCYSMFKTDIGLEFYITNVRNYWYRKALSRFRFGMSEINCSFLQFNRHIFTGNDLMCPFCKTQKETEIHFLLVCPEYDDLRLSLIPEKFFRRPSSSRFSILMATPLQNINVKLAEFVYRALRTRHSLLE